MKPTTITILILTVAVVVLTYLFAATMRENREYREQMTTMQNELDGWLAKAEKAMDVADTYVAKADSAASAAKWIERDLPIERERYHRERAQLDTAHSDWLKTVILWRNK